MRQDNRTAISVPADIEQTLTGTAMPTADEIAALLDTLRTRAIRVHCLTNNVAQSYTANMLLACGLVPSMTIAPAEVPDFAASADALLINLGTMDPERQKSFELAVTHANNSGKPWLLDPVLINRSPTRASYAKTLCQMGPDAIRLNEHEFHTLSDCAANSKNHGLIEEVKSYAGDQKTIFALTGSTDIVTDGVHLIKIENGHSWMASVTAMGCAISAVAAAALAVKHDKMEALAGTLAIAGICGEIAATKATGPGSFAAAILDVLHSLSYQQIYEHLKIISERINA